MRFLTPGPWYEANTSDDQGVIAEEKTGRTVAVVYDKKDAPVIAAAQEMLDSLSILTAYAAQFTGNGCRGEEGQIVDLIHSDMTSLQTIVNNARAVIAKAKGE